MSPPSVAAEKGGNLIRCVPARATDTALTNGPFPFFGDGPREAVEIYWFLTRSVVLSNDADDALVSLRRKINWLLRFDGDWVDD